MNIKSLLPLFAAIILGGIAFVLSKNLGSGHGSTTAPTGSHQAVVAKQTVEAGQILKEEDLTTAPLAVDAGTTDLFTNPSDVVGRVLVGTLVKGQAVVPALLAPAGSPPGLQSMVPHGMRAITVEVNEFSAVAGFVEPGARVDLIETFVSNGNQMARTIAQNVKIQAVNHRLSAVPADPAAPPQSTTSVTLLVSPATAQLVQLAASTGRPHLALRGLDDQDVNELTEVTGSQLRGQSDLQTTVAPAEPAPVQPVIDSTTRPAAAPASAAPTTRPSQRIVQIIRAGVPSEIRMQIPAVREPNQMTEADQNY